MSEQTKQKEELILAKEEISATIKFLREQGSRPENEKNRAKFEKAVLLLESFGSTLEKALDNFDLWALIAPDLLEE